MAIYTVTNYVRNNAPRLGTKSAASSRGITFFDCMPHDNGIHRSVERYPASSNDMRTIYGRQTAAAVKTLKWSEFAKSKESHGITS